MKQNYSLGILSIATNGYVRYLSDLIQSGANNLGAFTEYCHYIFTDDVNYVTNLAENFPNTQMEIIEIPSLGWPEATLLRYEIYSKYKHIFKHDILMHLDSDMYFLSNLVFEIPVSNWQGGMAFVEHPGFFRPSIQDLSPKALRARLRAVLAGGYGDWETSKRSSAYTARGSRQRYCCGGAWFGLREEFLIFCEACHENVEIDSKTGVVAKWHDESHLNFLVSLRQKPTIFSSRFCYEPNYGKVLSNPILLAVNKATTLENQLKSIGVNL